MKTIFKDSERKASMATDHQDKGRKMVKRKAKQQES